MRPRETSEIRVRNLQAVWEALQRADGDTRTGLAAATGLSLMSISNLVEQFRDCAFVFADTASLRIKRPNAGRRAEILRVNAARLTWLILDLTDPFFQWTAVRLDRRPERSGAPWRYDWAGTCEENLRAFLAQVRQETAGLRDRLGGIAVVAPGPYDPATDTIVNTRIPALNEMPLKAFVTAQMGREDIPVFVDEDVKFAARAYGELAGDGESLYYLYAGEGVGGALIYQGGVFHSLNSVAGDPSLLEILGCGPGCEGLTLRGFAGKLGLEGGQKSGKALMDDLREIAAMHPRRYESALAEAAGETVLLLRAAQAMLDPHAVVVDCLWAAPMQSRFLSLVRAGLRPVEPLRRQPRVIDPELPLHAPWYGAVKVLEKNAIRRLNASE